MARRGETVGGVQLVPVVRMREGEIVGGGQLVPLGRIQERAVDRDVDSLVPLTMEEIGF